MPVPTFDRLEKSEVTPEVVTDIQLVHREGWREDMKDTRSEEEIASRFPLQGAGFDEAGATYADFAKHGNLVVAREAGHIVGVAMTRNDVGPVRVNGVVPVMIRTVKRTIGAVFPQHSPVHPWTRSVVVAPEFQRRRYATRLLHLSHQQGFNMHQTATAYVFDEDERYEVDEQDGRIIVAAPPEPFSGGTDPAYEFLKSVGFRLVRDRETGEWERQSKPGYFDILGSRPVIQYIMKAEVDVVRTQTNRPLRLPAQ